MKKLRNVLIILLVIFIGLIIFRNPLIKTVVATVASQVTGAPVSIDSFAVGIFKQAVSIKGFKLYNPKGFPEDVLLDIPEVTVEYGLSALLKGKIHLPLIVLNLSQMVVAKNKDNVLNVDALKIAQKKEEPVKAASEKKEPAKKPSKPLAMQIDVARLKIGRVVFKDYSKSDQPAITAYDVGIDKEYKNITSAQQFATLIMVEAMGPTAIKGAAIYGAATVLGVAFLPAGVAGVLIGKDSGSADFNYNFDKVYDVVIEVINQKGEVTKENRGAGVIKAKVGGAGVTVEITKQEKNKTQVKASARKFMLPKPEIAEGIIYQISEKLK